MKKKILSIFLAALLVVSLLPVTAFATTPNYAAGGNGTEADPYQIDSLTRLNALAEAVLDGTDMQGKYFVLTADFTINGEYKPIGTQGKVFSGTFDGKGHTLTLSIGTNEVPLDVSSYPDYGVFGQNKGTIRNLIVKGDMYVSSSDNPISLGGLVGENNGFVQNCASVTNVHCAGDGSQYQSSQIGVLIGDQCTAISNCFSSGTVSCSVGRKATYLGACLGNTQAANTNCYYDSTVAGDIPCYGQIVYATLPVPSGLTTEKMQAASGTDGALVDRLNSYTEGEPAAYPDGWLKWKVAAENTYPVFDAPVTVSDWTGLQTAITGATGPTTIKLTNDLTASDTGANSITIPEGKDITLDLNGHVLNRDLITNEEAAESEEPGCVININTSCAFEIKDSSPSAIHYFEYHTDGPWILTGSAVDGAIDIDDIDGDTTDGEIIKVLGGCITGGNNISSDGGGVFISNGGSLTMNGGNIIGNKALNGGGVCLSSSWDTFVMNGGLICGNIAATGGGVFYSIEECLAAGTPITLASGERELIENLQKGTAITVFDHETGTTSSATLFDVWKYPEKKDGAAKLHFSNGIDVTVVGGHCFYEKEAKKYISVTKYNAKDYIGHEFYNMDSARWEKLEGVTYLSEAVDTYVIVSEKNLNCAANGMLSAEDGIYELLINVFDFDNEMKIDQQQKAAAIRQHGEWTIADCPDMSESAFDALNFRYMPIIFAKGGITPKQFDDLAEYSLLIDPELYSSGDQARPTLLRMQRPLMLLSAEPEIVTGLAFGGTAKVYENKNGNVYLAGGRSLTVGTGNNNVSAPKAGMNVWVTMEAGKGQFALNGTQDDANKFHADNTAYQVQFNTGEGKSWLELVKKPDLVVFPSTQITRAALDDGTVVYQPNSDMSIEVSLEYDGTEKDKTNVLQKLFGEKASLFKATGDDKSASCSAIPYTTTISAIDGIDLRWVKLEEDGSFKYVVDSGLNQGFAITVKWTIAKASQTQPGAKEGYVIDYVEETVTIDSGYEISKTDDPSFAAETLSDNKIAVVPGTTYYIRKKETDTHLASSAVDLEIPARPEAPKAYVSDLTDTSLTVLFNDAWEYKFEDGEWNSGSGSNVFDNLDPANKYKITVRIKADGDTPASMPKEISHWTMQSKPDLNGDDKEAYTVDPITGKINFNRFKYNISTGPGFSLFVKPGDILTDGTYYIRKAAVIGGAPASDYVTFTFETHEAAAGGSSVAVYDIITETAENGSIIVDKKTASAGRTVTVTVTPDKGFTLETLTVLDKNGKDIEVKNLGNNKYSFKMPSGKVSISATFMEDNSMLNFFVDVKADDYYYDAVLWAAKNDITNGIDETHFAPFGITTRGQMVTFLWRAAGSPEPTETVCRFTDVKADKYYYKAVLWAAENGITKGMSETTFCPDEKVSRAQAVTFLARTSGVKDDAAGYTHSFTDVRASDYYNNAVAWAAENNITNGTGGAKFSPNMDCLRNQVVSFLYRYVVK